MHRLLPLKLSKLFFSSETPRGKKLPWGYFEQALSILAAATMVKFDCWKWRPRPTAAAIFYEACKIQIKKTNQKRKRDFRKAKSPPKAGSSCIAIIREQPRLSAKCHSLIGHPCYLRGVRLELCGCVRLITRTQCKVQIICSKFLRRTMNRQITKNTNRHFILRNFSFARCLTTQDSCMLCGYWYSLRLTKPFSSSQCYLQKWIKPVRVSLCGLRAYTATICGLNVGISELVSPMLSAWCNSNSGSVAALWQSYEPAFVLVHHAYITHQIF